VDGKEIGCQPTHPAGTAMPNHPVVFRNAFRYYRHGQNPQTFKAEGMIDGNVVAEQTISAWDRRETFVLEADTCGVPLRADGEDFIPVVAKIIDKRGQVIRLTDDTVRFTVKGPAEIIGDGQHMINPQKLTFGEAVVLVRAQREAGTITVKVRSARPGDRKPEPAEIVLTTEEVQ